MKPFATVRDLLWRATRHWLSAIGVLLASVASVAFLILLAVELSGRQLSNYTGILSYVILPGLFLLGLALIPIGLWRLRKQEKAGKPSAFPIFNFNDPRLRGIALVTAAVTVVNLMLVSTATFKGLEVLHSDQFCGGTCHTVMQPEDVAHKVTAHAKVQCADCHIGEGATHFVNAKVRGATQLLQFIVGDVDRPIPQPTEVATAICTRCHAPERFSEDRLHVRRMYGDEEKAVEKITVYRNRIGGFRDGQWQGVHKHNGMSIRYRSDPKRAVITEISLTRPDGGTDAFVAKGVTAPADAQWFQMGCTDCHSRPAHRYSTPNAIVEQALGRGAIDKELPFIHREAVTALKGSYPSHDAARKGIPAALTAFYATVSPAPDAAKVEAAGRLLATEWTHNNFPDMKVTWGSYTDYFQHEPGCYRCHDKNHENAQGVAIGQKCSGACHDIIASEEEQPEVIDVLYP
jgi:hypothetical protein